MSEPAQQPADRPWEEDLDVDDREEGFPSGETDAPPDEPVDPPPFQPRQIEAPRSNPLGWPYAVTSRPGRNPNNLSQAELAAWERFMATRAV
jgi:hypothetical protein